MEIKMAGIDYSLTCPCVAIYCGEADRFSFEDCRFFYLIGTDKYCETYHNGIIWGDEMPDWKTDEERYDRISAWVIDILTKNEIESVFIEGYSMGSKGRVFNLAENCGVLKHKIWKRKIEIEIVAPTAVKKYATGKGNSDKEKMHESFVAETGVDLQKEICPDKGKVGSPVGDIVDAYYILKYGVESGNN